MLLADVNVFIYAHRAESAHHDEYRSWLEQALRGPEPFGVSELVLSSFLRIVTHSRVYREPTPLDIALDFCAAVVDAPSAARIRPGPDHWRLFTTLLRDGAARGNHVPDAYLAALAVEAGATWVTTDRGFARYPQLRWITPLS